MSWLDVFYSKIHQLFFFFVYSLINLQVSNILLIQNYNSDGIHRFFRILQFIFNIICLALCAAHFRQAKAFALGVSSANMIYNIYTLFIVPQMEQKRLLF